MKSQRLYRTPQTHKTPHLAAAAQSGLSGNWSRAGEAKLAEQVRVPKGMTT